MKNFKFTKTEKISFILALLVLVVLFISSSMTYKQQEMDPAEIKRWFGFIEPVIKNWNIKYAGAWHNRVSDGGIAGFTQFFVRKLAHFGTYFLLGIFSYFGLKRVFVFKWTGPFFVWFMTIAFAAFDEYHQYLTGDRTPSVHDVMLDGAGSLCGIIILLVCLAVTMKIGKNKAINH